MRLYGQNVNPIVLDVMMSDDYLEDFVDDEFDEIEPKRYKKTCNKCGTVYEYFDPEELKEWFYFKSGYFMNTCKKCELEKHAKKYKQGKYNYRKKRNEGFYDPQYIIGNFDRCCFVSQHDNHPCFGRFKFGVGV